MCFSKISNAWTAKPASDAAAPIDGENRLAAFKGYALANLWSSRRVRAAAAVQKTGVTQRR